MVSAKKEAGRKRASTERNSLGRFLPKSPADAGESLERNPIAAGIPSQPLTPTPVPTLVPVPTPVQEVLTLSPGKRRRPIDLTPTDLAIGREWLTLGLSEMPWKASDPSWTETRFAEAVAKTRAAIGATDLTEVLNFIRQDDFWRKNACSPRGLLKKSERNGERKIDNILVRMRSNGERQHDAIKKWAES